MVSKPLQPTLPPALSSPVPLDRPFTTAMATAAGISRRQLDLWVAQGALSRPIKGVFHAADLPDSLGLRIEVLRLIVPESCVVTDRTAGWLWGANMILAPNDHLVVPKARVFSPPGLRLRNGLVSSGERTLASTDVALVEGLRVTTPLRTACDLGRLLHRDQAFAAMDSLAGLRCFSVDELVDATRRFAGYRGVIQLRALAPFVDPGSQSPGESILRLRWLDLGFPPPKCQVEVPAPCGGSYWIDIGLEEQRFGAEYDGEDFHTEDDAEQDQGRRDWMRRAEGWRLVVARKADIHGPHQRIDQELLRAASEVGLRRR